MKRLVNSFGNAARGLLRGFATGGNLLWQVLAVAVVVAVGLWLGFAAWQWVACVLCCAAVIALELLNTAIERLCDVVQPEQDARIGAIKDIAAGAVLWTAIGSVIVFMICIATAMK